MLYGNYIEESYNTNISNNINIITYINESCECNICSLTPIDEEYVIVNEIYFSKKDLQDPETLKKLLNRAEKEKDIKKKLDDFFIVFSFIEAILAAVGVGVLTKSIINAFLSFLPLMIACFTAAEAFIASMDNVMLKIHEGRIKKLRKKAEELRNKAKSAGKNEIANNCQKLIDAIDKYYKKVENDKFNERVKFIEKYYKNLVDIIHGKFYMEEPRIEYFVLAKILKISFDRIDNGQKAYRGCDEPIPIVLEYFFGEDNIEKLKADPYYEYEKFCELIPEFKEPKSNSKIPVYYTIDDTVFIYSKKADVFFYGDYFADSKYISKSIYNFCKNFKSEIDPNKDIDAIKVADAKLGYYILSEPPEGVKRKKI